MELTTRMKADRGQHTKSVILYGSAAVLTLLWTLKSHAVSEREILGLFGGGLLSWTLVEYLLHRFPFHFATAKEPWRTILAGQHLLHHEYPNHPDHVNAPLLMSLPIYLILLGLFCSLSALLGEGVVPALLLGSGLSTGFLVYEWIHYSAHHRPARTPLGKYLKRYHLLHHFKDSENYFGVSSPFWDILFGTKPDYRSERERQAPSRGTPLATARKGRQILPIASRDRAIPMGQTLSWQSLLK